MIDPPQITDAQRQIAAVVHLQCPRDEIKSLAGPAISEVLDALNSQGQTPQGPMFMHHLTMSSAEFDVEVGFPVATPIVAQGRVRPGQLPATRVARTVYHGAYEGLHGAWDAFGKRLERDGLVDRRLLAPIRTLWERYLVGPETTPDTSQWRTELNLPLAPVENA